MRLLIVILLIIPAWTFAQFEHSNMKMDSLWMKLTDSTFFELVNDNNFRFELPDSFDVVTVIKNRDAFYQYAICHQEKGVETRYLIRNVNYSAYDSTLKIDDFSYSLLAILSMNAAGNNFTNIPLITTTPIRMLALHPEIEWEGIAEFNPKSEFGKGFTFCRLFSRRVRNKCIIYYFILYHDYPTEKYLEDIILKSIRY